MAASLRAEWFVVYVERPGELRSRAAERQKIVDLLSFAEAGRPDRDPERSPREATSWWRSPAIVTSRAS